MGSISAGGGPFALSVVEGSHERNGAGIPLALSKMRTWRERAVSPPRTGRRVSRTEWGGPPPRAAKHGPELSPGPCPKLCADFPSTGCTPNPRTRLHSWAAYSQGKPARSRNRCTSPSETDPTSKNPTESLAPSNHCLLAMPLLPPRTAGCRNCRRPGPLWTRTAASRHPARQIGCRCNPESPRPAASFLR